MEQSDTYKTLSRPSEEILFKEKKSKFFGYAFPVQSEEDVKSIIEQLRTKHHTAGHVCYAWQLGTTNVRYRANDDGEPNNSAGMPIYGQIQSFEVTNVLVAVARIFGGTKLGVGGLITAYKTSAQMALENADIVKKTITSLIEIKSGYDVMNNVMRIIKQNQLEIVSQQLELDCSITIRVAQSKTPQIVEKFNVLKGIKAKEISA